MVIVQIIKKSNIREMNQTQSWTHLLQFDLFCVLTAGQRPELAVSKSELSEGSNEGSPHSKAESSQLALKLLSFRDHCLYTDD